MPNSKRSWPFSFAQSAKSLQENVSRSGHAAAAGYGLIAAIVLLGGVGYAVDLWMGTTPWGVLIGLCLGVIIGLYELMKVMWRQ
jgi:ATP synthase protein I